MYKVYGTVASRAFRVLWMLEELNEPYELIETKPGTDLARSVNVSGKIPVLVDGDSTLTDSTAILTYLADKHGALTYPAGTVERAHQDALMHTVLDEFDAVLWTAARYGFILPEDRRVPQIREGLMWEFERNLDRLAARFVGPFLQGDRMTVADIIAVHCMNWAIGAKFPVRNDVMDGYAKAMRARDAFKRARQDGGA